MKYYAPENASFLFPFYFDPALLFGDLEKCRAFDFLKNYVPTNYDGDDYILPLRSINGRMDFAIAALGHAGKFMDTPALKQCLYFTEVINSFKCDKEAVRLMNLPAGRVVNMHTDHSCGYEDGIFRVHIPIITNEQVCFTINGHDLTMRPGEAWYTNVNLPHGVRNEGATNRIHLVIDCLRNEWSDKLFESVGYDFRQEKEAVELLSDDVRLRMIQELESQDLPGAKWLLEQLKQGDN